MNLAERLRTVIRAPQEGGPEGPPLRTSGPPSDDAVAEMLGGEWRESRGQRHLVVERTYPAGHRVGHVAVAESAPDEDGRWGALSVLESSIRPGRMLFIDLETTGLAGGAGTYAFLIGCGWFEGASFRIRQFVLTSYAAERTLLEDVAETAGAACALVTYNGKTFDLPLIETRFLFHRMRASFPALPHIDMLHPARRLWRSAATGGSASQDPPYVRRPGSARLPDSSVDPASRRRPTCCQKRVEEDVLGHVREGDVPGFEIPSRYFHYVRTGDPRPLEAVLEHNRLDLLGLAMLTGRAAHLLEEGVAAARTAREALGLGRLYARAGRTAEARDCYARAAGIDHGGVNVSGMTSPKREREGGEDGARAEDPATRAEALQAYALLRRREHCHREAAEAWQQLLDLRHCPPHFVQQATEALAVHHEHRLRDPRTARQFTTQSLQFTLSLSHTERLNHRLARLDRKVGLSGSYS